MVKNMGSTDKIIRLLAAVLVAVLYYTGVISGTTAIVLGVIAIIFVITSMLNFCPLYTVLGINTRKK
ncbi:MAG: DUF2892 domain-containing protein [Chitinophagales bacterium]|nr:DUF2892 domain-containing protein [Bacteroidota bacterium]MCB9043170.1 DUF2892 domain-containing protein [Chitinophagales bacterium]